MNIPTPQEIGMPEHITDWRQGQPEFIEAILADRTRTTANCAGTGFGKTDAYMGAAIISKRATCIVTDSKGLQNQIMKDYGPLGAVDIRGRANYTCDMRPGMTCEDGQPAQCPYKETPGCPSKLAEMKAAVSSLVVTNYDKWIAARKFSTGMSHFTQVIFDEAHHAPHALAKEMQVIIHFKEIEETLKMDFPPVKFREEVSGWRQWAIDAKANALEIFQETDTQIKSSSNPKQAWFRLYNHMRQLLQRLARISTARSNDWVVEELPDIGYQFDPISPARYAESILLFRIPKIVMVSATMRPRTLHMTGISRSMSEFREFESDFDPLDAPIFWVKTIPVDYKNRDRMSMVWMRLDQVAGPRHDRNGIVHTISYQNQKEALAYSRYSDSMIFNRQGEPSAVDIEEFKNTYPGSILCSPSVGTGYDFPGTQAEWQFVCKIPFIDGRSKIIKARQNIDKDYKSSIAAESLLQIVGRTNRFRGDRCEHYIPDDHMEWFIPRNEHLFTKSFLARYQNRVGGRYGVINRVPSPPERMEVSM